MSQITWNDGSKAMMSRDSAGALCALTALLCKYIVVRSDEFASLTDISNPTSDGSDGLGEETAYARQCVSLYISIITRR